MSKEELQVNFRMPAMLKLRLEQAAKESRRSVTAEVVARLEESLEPRFNPATLTTLGEAIDMLMAISKASGFPIQVIIGESDEKDEDDD